MANDTTPCQAAPDVTFTEESAADVLARTGQLPSFPRGVTSDALVLEGQPMLPAHEGDFTQSTIGEDWGRVFEGSRDRTLGNAERQLRSGNVIGAVEEIFDDPGDFVTTIIGEAARGEMPGGENNTDTSPHRRGRY